MIYLRRNFGGKNGNCKTICKMGWIYTRNNLKETFDRMNNIYNIADMKNRIMEDIFI